MFKFVRHQSALIAVVTLVAISAGGVMYAYRRAETAKENFEAQSGSGSVPIALLDSTEFDWGQISRREIAKQDFRIVNNGKSDLIVTRIVTSCGCTKADLRLGGQNAFLPASIPPAGEGTVHVEFNPAAHDSRGNTERAVRIETNDPSRHFLVINLRAYVR